jgi:hypothetical protein
MPTVITRTPRGHGPSGGFERVDVTWTVAAGASDVTQATALYGEVRSVITAPDTVVRHYAVRLLDADNSDIDYLRGNLATVSSDAVQFWLSDTSTRPPIIIGPVNFQVSDAGAGSTGRTIMFLKS